MKKILFLLIAISSCASLMGVNTNTPSEFLCPTAEDDTNACCGSYLPQTNQPPFYQPNSSILTIQNDEAYLPQVNRNQTNAPIIPRRTSHHSHRTQYNPADPLFEAIRNWFSSRRVVPLQNRESLNAPIELESIRPSASYGSSIINCISHCMSLDMCRRCRNTE